MADLSPLRASLNSSKMQTQNNALYQTIKGLIDLLDQNNQELLKQLAGVLPITEEKLLFRDTDKQNATIAKHGLLPKLPNDPNEFLDGQGNWTAPAGGGDVVGPSSAEGDNVAVFDGATGKLIKDGGQTIAEIIAAGGDGDVLGPATSVDNSIARFNGTNNKTIQDSTPKVEDDGRISGVTNPTGDQDAATKDYVNDQIGAIAKPIRKVGCSLDGGGSAITTGVKGSIQVDFSGTIIGWSIEADVSGNLTVEVDKKAGTQTAPAVPNTTTDKISASAPILLSDAQTAGADATGVSTWTTTVAQWDSIQFNVTVAATITRATLWVRIQET